MARSNRSPLVLIALVLVATLGAVIFAVEDLHLDKKHPPFEEERAQAKTPDAGSALPPPLAQTSATSPLPTTLPLPAPVSKAEQVRRLAASEDAADALRAYQLVRTCKDARLMEVDAKQDPTAFAVAPPSPNDACGDVEAGQMSSRLIYLRRAASAGVPGALWPFVSEGPSGDGTPEAHESDLPAVREWWSDVERFVAMGAQQGDVYALQTLSMHHDNDPGQRDLELAFAYWLAANEMHRARHGRPLTSSFELQLKHWKARLSPAEFHAGEVRAMKLIGSIKERAR